MRDRADEQQIKFSDEGLAALIFTAEGDMRQAINNLQSTWSGFNFVSPENVFKICDQPHPLVVQTMIKHCQKGEIDQALARIDSLWDQGYSAVDIVVTIFRVVKGMEELPEYTKLEFIRVSPSGSMGTGFKLTLLSQEIGWTHMRILEGVGTLVQLGAMIARLCRMSVPPEMLKL